MVETGDEERCEDAVTVVTRVGTGLLGWRLRGETDEDLLPFEDKEGAASEPASACELPPLDFDDFPLDPPDFESQDDVK